jgi:hypothetical protein
MIRHPKAKKNGKFALARSSREQKNQPKVAKVGMTRPKKASKSAKFATFAVTDQGNRTKFRTIHRASLSSLAEKQAKFKKCGMTRHQKERKNKENRQHFAGFRRQKGLEIREIRAARFRSPDKAEKSKKWDSSSGLQPKN